MGSIFHVNSVFYNNRPVMYMAHKYKSTKSQTVITYSSQQLKISPVCGTDG